MVEFSTDFLSLPLGTSEAKLIVGITFSEKVLAFFHTINPEIQVLTKSGLLMLQSCVFLIQNELGAFNISKQTYAK